MLQLLQHRRGGQRRLRHPGGLTKVSRGPLREALQAFLCLLPPQTSPGSNVYVQLLPRVVALGYSQVGSPWDMWVALRTQPLPLGKGARGEEGISRSLSCRSLAFPEPPSLPVTSLGHSSPIQAALASPRPAAGRTAAEPAAKSFACIASVSACIYPVRKVFLSPLHRWENRGLGRHSPGWSSQPFRAILLPTSKVLCRRLLCLRPNAQ